MKPPILIIAILLLPLSACDDSGSFHPNDRSGAPRGTFNSGAGGQVGNSAPERGEQERVRLDNRSQRRAPPPSGGASASASNAATTGHDPQHDPQDETLTGCPTAPRDGLTLTRTRLPAFRRSC